VGASSVEGSAKMPPSDPAPIELRLADGRQEGLT
jgi:hypothetical protein